MRRFPTTSTPPRSVRGWIRRRTSATRPNERSAWQKKSWTPSMETNEIANYGKGDRVDARPALRGSTRTRGGRGARGGDRAVARPALRGSTRTRGGRGARGGDRVVARPVQKSCVKRSGDGPSAHGGPTR